MLSDFKAFLLKANVVGLSLAVIVGGAAGALVTAMTVSYTHLDVYKRQGHPGRGAGGSRPSLAAVAVVGPCPRRGGARLVDRRATGEPFASPPGAGPGCPGGLLRLR